MMAYLTRPATPTKTPYTRQQAASGGVIGEGGMFQGEDLGNRTGFKKLKPNITKEKFIEEYKIFQESKNNIGLDSEFADYLNKNYTTIRGKKFNTKSVFKARSDLGVKTKVGTVPPSVQARFDKINAILPDLISDLNSKEKYVTKEQLSSMVEKKLNIPGKYNAAGFKISQLDSDNYPIVKTLDKVPDKIENTLKNMLIQDKPLNDFFLDALQKRVGVRQETINTGLNNSPTYKVIADQGAYDLRFRFNKNLDHSFLKELSFSDQLTKGIDMREGQPTYTKMGNAKIYGSSPKNKVMEFAIRSWNVNQGKGPVKFFDKKTGQRITWDYGKKLPYKEVSFLYNGKKFNAEKLNDIDVVKKSFPEVYKNQIAINNLGKEMVDDPFKKGSKISAKDLIKTVQVNAYEWSPKTGTLDILHGPKGVGLEPFTNLNYNTKDINQIELGLSQGLKAGTLSQSQVNQTLKLINKAVPSNPQSIIARQTALVEDYKKGKLGSFTDISDEIRALTEASEKTKLEDIEKILRVSKKLQKNGLPKTAADEVTEALQTMQNKFGSGLDPMDVARWAKAELGVIQEIGAKYGGKVFNNLAAIDVPIAQVLFAKEVTDFSEDSPLWTTLPMAFTDEVAKYYNLYDRSGGKISNFIKLAASSGVPAKLAKTIFPIVSKAGKLGSTYALPALQLAQEGYNEYDRRKKIDYEGEKFERLFPDKISKDKMMEDYRQDQRDRVPELTDDMDVPEISERGQQNLDSIKRGAQSLGSLFGLADDPYAYNKPNIPGTPLVASDYSDGGSVDIKDVIQEYNNGGRVGYADGPKDPKRRTIIKGLTALAAVPFIGRYFKLAKPVDKAISGVQTVIEKVKGLPDWFQPFVNKVLKVGKDVTDEAATIEREIVKRVDIEDATVDVHYNTATNDVRVEIVGGKNAFDEPLSLEYKAPEIIEETGKKTKGEFRATESQPIQTSPDDIELEAYDTDVLDDLLSETDYLEGFATGKIRTPAEIKKANKKTFHRDNIRKNPSDYILEQDMGNFSSPDAKAYETITDLDGIENILDIVRK
jgi:hypothetical protein